MAGAVAALDATPLAAILAIPGSKDVLWIPYDVALKGQQCISLMCETPSREGYGGGQNKQDAKGGNCIHGGLVWLQE